MPAPVAAGAAKAGAKAGAGAAKAGAKAGEKTSKTARPEIRAKKGSKPEKQRLRKKEPQDLDFSDYKDSSGNDILSPAGILMLFLAFMFDVSVGLIVLILHFFAIGPFVSWFFHLIGFLFFGLWIFFRSGKITMKKIGGKIIKRGGVAWIVSSIPLLGDIVPCWTIAVYRELKNG